MRTKIFHLYKSTVTLATFYFKYNVLTHKKIILKPKVVEFKHVFHNKGNKMYRRLILVYFFLYMKERVHNFSAVLKQQSGAKLTLTHAFLVVIILPLHTDLRDPS